MKLILTQPEIEAILRSHINETVTLATGNDFAINFVATRSDDGITATIDIPYMGVTSIPAIANAQDEKAETPAAAPTPRTRATKAQATAAAPAPAPTATVTATEPAAAASDDAAPFPPADEPSGDQLERDAAAPEQAEPEAAAPTPPADTTPRKSLFAAG